MMRPQIFINLAQLGQPASLHQILAEGLARLSNEAQEVEIELVRLDMESPLEGSFVVSFTLPVEEGRKPNFAGLVADRGNLFAQDMLRVILAAAYQSQLRWRFRLGVVDSSHTIIEEMERFMPQLRQSQPQPRSLLIEVYTPDEVYLFSCPVDEETGWPDFEALTPCNFGKESKLLMVRGALKHALRQAKF